MTRAWTKETKLMSRSKNEDFQQMGVKESMFSAAAFHLLSLFSRGHRRTRGILPVEPERTGSILSVLLPSHLSLSRIPKILCSQTCLSDEMS